MKRLLWLILIIMALTGCSSGTYAVSLGGVPRFGVRIGTAPITGPEYTSESVVLDAAQEFGVPASLALALMSQESGGDPNSISSAGARGLLQVMPATAVG